MIRVLITEILMAMLLSANAATALAHPFHVSSTEVEWNSNSGRFEIAMNLSISDLEDALSIQEATRVRIDPFDREGRHLANYIRQHFQMTCDQSDACDMHWLGSECELHNIWLYFELQPRRRSSDSTSAGPVSQQPPSSRTTRLQWNDLFSNDDSLMRSSGTKTDDVPGVITIFDSRLFSVQPDQVHQVTLSIQECTHAVQLTSKKRQVSITPDLLKKKSQIAISPEEHSPK